MAVLRGREREAGGVSDKPTTVEVPYDQWEDLTANWDERELEHARFQLAVWRLLRATQEILADHKSILNANNGSLLVPTEKLRELRDQYVKVVTLM